MFKGGFSFTFRGKRIGFLSVHRQKNLFFEQVAFGIINRFKVSNALELQQNIYSLTGSNMHISDFCLCAKLVVLYLFFLFFQINIFLKKFLFLWQNLSKNLDMSSVYRVASEMLKNLETLSATISKRSTVEQEDQESY